jgi:hypothetical protein
MSYILAIEPDATQSAVLRRALNAAVGEKVVIVASKEAALVAIDRQVPDVVLLHALMSPQDDDYFVAYLCALPGTRHVQVIRIPQLLAPMAVDDNVRVFDRWTKRRDKASWFRCEPQLFAEDVVGYLARAHTLKRELTLLTEEPAQADRRRASRLTPSDVPWLSSVRLAAGEHAELVDISLSGALVRTSDRPHLVSIRGGGVEAWARPGLLLELASGEQVQVTGDVVRCRPAQGVGYQVAFRFDRSAELYLPALLLPNADEQWTRAMAVAKVVGGPTLYLPQALNQWCQW